MFIVMAKNPLLNLSSKFYCYGTFKTFKKAEKRIYEIGRDTTEKTDLGYYVNKFGFSGKIVKIKHGPCNPVSIV